MLIRPVIMLVDDEPQTLTPLLDALARRFGGDYQIVSHLSATMARKGVDPLRPKAARALIIADLGMPEMPGLEFLKRAQRNPAHQRDTISDARAASADVVGSVRNCVIL